MSYQKYYALDDVRAAAAGRWVDVLGHFDVRTELLRPRHGPCPGCGGKDRFRFDNIDGAGSFLCSQGGGGVLAGDGLALLGHCTGWDWKRCVQEVGDYLHVDKRRGAPRKYDSRVVPEPQAERVTVPELNMEAVRNFTRGVPEVDFNWLKRRSPIDVATCDTDLFFKSLYKEGERILIFNRQTSQGDFLHWEGKGNYRLAQERSVRAAFSSLPSRGREGIWYMVQPVTGQWAINPNQRTDAKYTRRSEVNVTAWRYFVLESDDLPAEDWNRVIVNLALPVAAIYTSGGRSVHAIVKYEVGSKAEWDVFRNAMRSLLCPLGADAGAMSAVRLSRLPGCLREGTAVKGSEKGYLRYPQPRMQELLYLDPSPSDKQIWMRPEVRE